MFDYKLIECIENISSLFLERTASMIQQWGHQHRIIAFISSMTRNYYVQNENTIMETASQCVNQWKQATEIKQKKDNVLRQRGRLI
jgi:hypothetical protein